MYLILFVCAVLADKTTQEHCRFREITKLGFIALFMMQKTGQEKV